jgi:hypothetical protein
MGSLPLQSGLPKANGQCQPRETDDALVWSGLVGFREPKNEAMTWHKIEKKDDKKIIE